MPSPRNPSQRLKGQETSILITQGGQLQSTLSDIQNFGMEAEFELISKGYLGEKTNRKDEIYNGCKFDMELHIHTQDWFTFQLAIKNRAQRNTPDVVFNITTVLQFPNGQTPTILIPDCFFGAHPMKIGSRGEYVSLKLEGEAEDFNPTLS